MIPFLVLAVGMVCLGLGAWLEARERRGQTVRLIDLRTGGQLVIPARLLRPRRGGQRVTRSPDNGEPGTR